MDKNAVQRAVQLAVSEAVFQKTGRIFVPVAASNRHIHLSAHDVERLFGTGYALQVQKMLSQPGQYAAKETLTVVGPKGSLEKVRVLGPAREQTQVEISITDSYKLGVKPVVRMSGDLSGTPGVALIGPQGRITVPEGTIVAARHLHLSAEQAACFGLKDRQVVSLRSEGTRSVTFHNVVVRCGKGHDMEVHFDTDEANAVQMKNGEMMEVLP